MADEYICKAEAVDAFEDTTFTKNEIRRRLLDIEPADVVPVVRCQNCEEYKVNYHWCRLHETEMSLTDFCSYGERKD